LAVPAADTKPAVAIPGSVEELLDRLISSLRTSRKGVEVATTPGNLRDRCLALLFAFFDSVARMGTIGDAFSADYIRGGSLEDELNEARAKVASLRLNVRKMEERHQDAELRVEAVSKQWRKSEARAQRAEERLRFMEGEVWRSRLVHDSIGEVGTDADGAIPAAVGPTPMPAAAEDGRGRPQHQLPRSRSCKEKSQAFSMCPHCGQALDLGAVARSKSPPLSGSLESRSQERLDIDKDQAPPQRSRSSERTRPPEHQPGRYPSPMSPTTSKRPSGGSTWTCIRCGERNPVPQEIAAQLARPKNNDSRERRDASSSETSVSLDGSAPRRGRKRKEDVGRLEAKVDVSGMRKSKLKLEQLEEEKIRVPTDLQLEVARQEHREELEAIRKHAIHNHKHAIKEEGATSDAMILRFHNMQDAARRLKSFSVWRTITVRSTAVKTQAKNNKIYEEELRELQEARTEEKAKLEHSSIEEQSRIKIESAKEMNRIKKEHAKEREMLLKQQAELENANIGERDKLEKKHVAEKARIAREKELLAKEKTRAVEQARNARLEGLSAVENAGERVAELYQKQERRHKLMRCIAAWHADALQSATTTKFNKELDMLKKQRSKETAFDAEQSAKVANQMATKFYNKHCHMLLQVCMSSWHKTALLGAGDREKAKQKEKFDAEIKHLKAQERKRGDEIADKMAERYRTMREHQLRQQFWGGWYKVTQKALMKKLAELAKEHAEREKKKTREACDDDIRRLQEEQRLLGESRGELVAAQYLKKISQASMLTVIRALRDAVIAGWAKKMCKQHDKQLRQLKEQERQKGDAVAEEMAAEHHRRKVQVAAQRCLGAMTWEAQRQIAEREKANQAAAFEAKLESMKQGERVIGGKKAEQMADQFQKKGLRLLMHEVITHWHKFEADERRRRKDKEIDYEMNRLKDLHDKQTVKREEIAEQMADRCQAKLNFDLKQGCFSQWTKETAEVAALKAQEKQRQRFEEEMRELQKVEREKADAVADKMGKQYYQRGLVVLKTELFAIWRAEVSRAAEADRMEEMKRQNEQELFETRRQVENDAFERQKQVVARAYKQYVEGLAQRCIAVWHKEAQLAGVQRRVADAKAFHAEELMNLKKAHLEKAEGAAEKMAATFKAKRDHVLIRTCFQVMERELGLHQQAKREAEIAQEFNKELDRLKLKDRQKGDQTAELMAEQAHRKHVQRVAAFLFTEWVKDVMNTLMQKRLEHKATEHNLAMSQVKLEEQRRREGYANQIAEDRFQNMATQVLAFVICLWRDQHFTDRAERIRIHEQQQFHDEMDVLRQGVVARTDAATQRLAETMLANINKELLSEVTSAWRSDASRAQFAAKAEAFKRQTEENMRRAREEEINRGLAQADRVALKIAHKHDQALMMRCLRPWNILTMKNLSDKLFEKATREHQLAMNSWQIRLDAAAETIAGKMFRKELKTWVVRCIERWQLFRGIVKVEDKLIEDYADREATMDEDFATLSKHYMEQKESFSKQMQNKFTRLEMLLLLTRALWKWAEALARGQADRALLEAQTQMDDDLAAMCGTQDLLRRKLVIKVGDFFTERIRDALFKRFMVFWLLSIEMEKANRETMMARTKGQCTIDTLQEDYSQWKVRSLDSVGTIFINKRLHEKFFHRIIGGWREVTWFALVGTFREDVKRKHQAEMDSFIKKQQALSQRCAEIVGRRWGQAMEWVAMCSIIHLWHEDCLTTRMINQFQKDMTRVRADLSQRIHDLERDGDWKQASGLERPRERDVAASAVRKEAITAWCQDVEGDEDLGSRNATRRGLRDRLHP